MARVPGGIGSLGMENLYMKPIVMSMGRCEDGARIPFRQSPLRGLGPTNRLMQRRVVALPEPGPTDHLAALRLLVQMEFGVVHTSSCREWAFMTLTVRTGHLSSTSPVTPFHNRYRKLRNFRVGATGAAQAGTHCLSMRLTHCPWLSLGDGPKPHCPRMPCRNRSRSPGVIASQRSAQRRRKPER